MKIKKNRCAFCKRNQTQETITISTNKRITDKGVEYLQLSCDNSYCGACGPWAIGMEDALLGWNKGRSEENTLLSSEEIDMIRYAIGADSEIPGYRNHSIEDPTEHPQSGLVKRGILTVEALDEEQWGDHVVLFRVREDWKRLIIGPPGRRLNGRTSN